MNSKLRKVQTRSEDKPVEIDLRGLGQFEIFKDVYVEPTLKIDNISEKEIAKISEHFQLTQTHENGHFTLKVSTNMDFKKKYIQLFAASAAVSKHNQACKFSLAETGGLNTHLSNGKNEHQESSTSDQISNLKENETIHISELASMTFVQIGLLSSSEKHSIVLNREQLLNIFDKKEEIQQKFLKVANGR